MRLGTWLRIIFVLSIRMIQLNYNPFRLSRYFYALLDDEVQSLSTLMFSLEVRNALFEIGYLKAPGVDGYKALFFFKINGKLWAASL